jgi:transposase
MFKWLKKIFNILEQPKTSIKENPPSSMYYKSYKQDQYYDPYGYRKKEGDGGGGDPG